MYVRKKHTGRHGSDACVCRCQLCTDEFCPIKEACVVEWNVVTWRSRRQSTVTTSTAASELVEAVDAHQWRC